MKKADFPNIEEFNPYTEGDFTPEQLATLNEDVGEGKDNKYHFMEDRYIRELQHKYNNIVKVSWANSSKFSERNFDSFSAKICTLFIASI